MVSARRPIYLLADSQPLFSHSEESIVGRIESQFISTSRATAAYLAASNGDCPAFFQVFKAAMSGIGIDDYRMIPTEPTQRDRDYLSKADLVLLAGGDVALGWEAFERAGLIELVRARYQAGATLVGVSAGAVQLGAKGWKMTVREREAFDTFNLAPWLIDVHDNSGWVNLATGVRVFKGELVGIGIPKGGTAIVHPDLTVEPGRIGLAEIRLVGNQVQHSLLVPRTSQAPNRLDPN